jgi:hypothetical protein
MSRLLETHLSNGYFTTSLLGAEESRLLRLAERVVAQDEGSALHAVLLPTHTPTHTLPRFRGLVQVPVGDFQHEEVTTVQPRGFYSWALWLFETGSAHVLAPITCTWPLGWPLSCRNRCRSPLLAQQRRKLERCGAMSGRRPAVRLQCARHPIHGAVCSWHGQLLSNKSLIRCLLLPSNKACGPLVTSCDVQAADGAWERQCPSLPTSSLARDQGTKLQDHSPGRPNRPFCC